jgi:hypothetical protein
MTVTRDQIRNFQLARELMETSSATITPVTTVVVVVLAYYYYYY